jgi:hypothetical protein
MGDAIFQLVTFMILISIILFIVNFFRSSKRKADRLNEIERKLDLLLEEKKILNK